MRPALPTPQYQIAASHYPGTDSPLSRLTMEAARRPDAGRVPPKALSLRLNIIRALVVLVLLFNGGAFMARTWWLTRYPHELDYGEGVVLWQAAHVFILRDAYHPIQRFPFIVFHYPPLYHVLSRVAGLITGDLLQGGRALTFFCTLASALTVAGIAWSAVPGSAIRRSMTALVAALLMLQTPSLTWAPNMRVDLTAISMTL